MIAPVSQDRAGALAALAQVTPGAGATRIGRRCKAQPTPSTDDPDASSSSPTCSRAGGTRQATAAFPKRSASKWRTSALPDANLAVTSLRVEGADAVAVVQNFSARPATDQVIFAVDARRIGAVPVTLAAGASVEARVPLDGVASGGLSASITDRDGYSADNARYADSRRRGCRVRARGHADRTSVRGAVSRARAGRGRRDARIPLPVAGGRRIFGARSEGARTGGRDCRACRRAASYSAAASGSPNSCGAAGGCSSRRGQTSTRPS